MPHTTRASTFDETDFGSAMRVLTVVVLLATLSAGLTVGVVQMTSASADVQAREVDLAGSQRLLTERIGYQVAALRSDPTNGTLRADLARTADSLTSVRLGLTRGDAQLGLDGVVPAIFSDFYGPNGLDLHARMSRFERAAADIAAVPGPVSDGPGKMIDAEVQTQRLVNDVDQAVSSLAATQEGQFTTGSRIALIGMAVMGILGLVSLVALAGVRARLRRQVAALDGAVLEIAGQERRFRTALEEAPTGIATVGPDGSFLTVNAALCEVTGRDEATLLARGLDGLESAVQRGTGQTTLATLLASGASTSELIELEMSDGSVRIVRVTVAEIQPGPGIDARWIISFSDLTQERQAIAAQAEVLHREQEAVAKLVELDETRSVFVSNISHELRTPLTSMIGYLEILGDGDVGELDDQQLRMVATATRNGQRLGRLIDDLLTLSVGGQGAETTYDVVDLSAVADDVADVLAPKAADRRLSLSINHEVDDRVHVRGNRRQLEQVLIHVVGNAIKFTPANGSIDVEVGTDPVDDEYTRIMVTDTGIGIAAEEQDRLFERFFRSERAQSEQVEGTGLGLAIAHQLVDEHEGHIEISSIENEGTVVTIILPKVDAEAESSPMNAVLWPMGSRLRDEPTPLMPVN